MARMTIGRFAREGGVGVETVRYYQRRGLLPVPAAGSTAYREYGGEELRRLAFIRRAQAAGFTLEEIRELLHLDRSRDRVKVRALAAGKLADLEQRLRELRQLERALRAVVHDCEHGDAAAPCPIVESFDPGPGRHSGRTAGRAGGRIRSHGAAGVP